MQPFPRFHHHLTTQKHDASLLVPSVVDLQGPKGSLPAAFTGARSSLERRFPRGQGPRGQEAGAPNHAAGILSRQLNISSTSRQLLEESRSGTSSPATTLHDYLHNSPSLAFHPDNDFMKRLPPIPRSAKLLHRHPGPLPCWRRLTLFGTLAGQTRGRLPLRVSLGTASDYHHGTRHFTQSL
jgi:hypothetical protein